VAVGIASGQERAVNAVNAAINSPLLETSIEGAKGVLFGVSGGRDLKMNEINEIAKVIGASIDPSARIIFGAYHDKRVKMGSIKVTLIATNFSGSTTPKTENASPSLFSTSTPATTLEFKPGHAVPLVMPVANSATMMSKELKEDSKKDKEIDKNTALKKKAADVWDIPTFLRRNRRD